MSSTCSMDCEGYNQCIQNIYKNVKTWGDIIETNINFLEGNQKITFYYSNEFHDDFYNENLWIIENDMFRLNREFHIFTHEGQSSMISHDNIVQRGYIAFVCQKNSAFIDRLLEDDRIYTFAREEYTDGRSRIIHNCPDEIALTQPHGSKFKIDTYDQDDNEIISLTSKFPDIQSLFENATHVFVMMREFPIKKIKNIQVTQCVLDAFEK